MARRKNRKCNASILILAKPNRLETYTASRAYLIVKGKDFQWRVEHMWLDFDLAIGNNVITDTTLLIVAGDTRQWSVLTCDLPASASLHDGFT
uniref:Uncharacterized protein n=4 Tax=Oryza TaxID=4527 RepID=A0A0D3GT33_9ORYZ